MRLRDIGLTVLLPVYNRGSLTGEFIGHLVSLLGADFPLNIVLFDDNSKDHTIQYAKHVYPGAIVVSMDGNSYWGGGINAASHFVRTSSVLGLSSSFFMLANDDIRFPSVNALFSAFDALISSPIVAARGLLVPSLQHTISHEDIVQSLCGFHGIHYDPSHGVFREAHGSHEVNVSSTWALIASRDVWLETVSVPHSIPHYLSDYWLTYHWTRSGYSIAHPNEFVCLVSSSSTRNVVCPKLNSGFCKRSTWIARRLTEVTSPNYSPAWICFWSQPPVTQFVFRLIAIRRIKFLFAKAWLALFKKWE